MILVKAPLRITLGGGGTDLPSYAGRFGGFCLSAAIDKYVYVSAVRPFLPGIYLHYSEMEKCRTVDEVRHPIMREALRLYLVGEPQIEITTLADIPSGTGLGSSGAFAVALLYALSRGYHHAPELAELAFQIEARKLGAPIGRQDQYASAYGGLSRFEFWEDGTVHAAPLAVSADTYHDLEDNLLLYFTGFERSAGSILYTQNTRTLADDDAMLDNLHRVKGVGLETARALEGGDLGKFADLLNQQWELKEQRTASPGSIVAARKVALAWGALGCKLVGAGGGGFLMTYAEDKRRLRSKMRETGLQEIRFHFDTEGVRMC